MGLFERFQKRQEPEKQPESPKYGISQRAVEQANEKPMPPELIPYEPPPGVIPPDERQDAMALDAVPYDYANSTAVNGAGQFVGYFFPGYQELSAMAQLPEYRKMSEEPAKDMVREWVKLHGTGDEDKSDKIAIIEAELKRHGIRDMFRQAAELDGFFGRAQIYVDVKMSNGKPASSDRAELRTPLLLNERKITKDSLLGFKLIEPIWTYPSAYNADNPLAQDYYRPSQWFVMGKTIHDSRLLMFLSRPVPDLLKPAYNFGGLSMSQMARPYVEHWVRTRNSVSDKVHDFSVNILQTNMQSVLQGGSDPSFKRRAQMFNALRDNANLMMLDKDQENFMQINTPLGGLSELQAQSQEHMSAVSNMPLVKLLGITPTGLNASSEGEIRIYYDYISSRQEILFRPQLEKVIRIIQLDKFGEIDPEIGFEFEPLYGLDETEAAQVRLNNAQADVQWVSIGALSGDEVRQRIANDPESGYEGLETDDADDTDLDSELDQRINMLESAAREGGDPNEEDDGHNTAGRANVLKTRARINDDAAMDK